MLIYTLRRLNLFLITLVILTLVGYNIMLLAPDSVWHGFDYWVGWLYYLRQLVEGHLGMAANGEPVMVTLAHVAPATLELCFAALVISFVVGVPLGTLAGLRSQGPTDKLISSLAVVVFSIPTFWLAILFIMLFSLDLQWFPVSGRYNLLYEIPHITGFALVDLWLSDLPLQGKVATDIMRHLALPTLTLAVVPTTEIIKMVRNSMAHVMSQNYIKAAATKGLSKTEIVLRHGMKNAIPPIIPNFGLLVSTMVTFVIIVESVFNWPGIGRWLLDALIAKDYASVQAGVLVIGGFVLLINIISDVVGAFMNPLVRKEWYALK
ncbi:MULTISPECIES: ABC transporter permease [unclassified Salinivibrio]|uniref:ABC transporter permease n=1 Tax=unclassified Salinivibrio TaxID=2636825 RepID=UPI0009869888|nr:MULTISPECIES: ABC transporter permease subunit [unclassified Salinivibrio]OOF10447.1 peptide ABC transporter permease [Salinivibrio sp. PR5]OOF12857.1 peptide ABC transporter permease [Salinivibrio sp. PR919]OOF16899.1 peptide ABC transporter permease [Salinivibrio sp. PR932]